MADVILSQAGAYVGEAVAGASGEVIAGLTASQLGSAIGAVVGSVINQMFIYPALFGRDDQELSHVVTVGALAGDITKPSATYGTPIPIIAGTEPVRIEGMLVWGGQTREEILEEVQRSVTKTSGGKGGGGSTKKKTTTYIKKYEYFSSFAFMFCRGPVSLVELRANGKKLSNEYITEGVTFHDGNDAQLPDSLIETDWGVGNTPAYRGRCYVVFRDVNLDPFGNRIPEVSAILQPNIINLSGLIALLLETSGLLPDMYEIDPNVDSITLKSVVLADTIPAQAHLKSIADAFGLKMWESDGKIRVSKA